MLGHETALWLAVIGQYALSILIYVDSRRQFRNTHERISVVDKNYRSLDMERRELMIQIKGLRGDLDDKLRPLREQLNTQDEHLMLIEGMSRDAVEQIATIRKRNTTH